MLPRNAFVTEMPPFMAIVVHQRPEGLGSKGSGHLGPASLGELTRRFRPRNSRRGIYVPRAFALIHVSSLAFPFDAPRGRRCQRPRLELV